MKTFRVYAQTIASKYLGEIEAEDKEEAIEKAWEEYGKEAHISLCHACSKIDLGDCDIEAEEEV